MMFVRNRNMLFQSLFLLFCLSICVYGSERVRMTDVSAITLHQGKMTNSRRVSPVPQLNCVGGTAGHNAPQPKVVQCMNQGSDGYDVQWKCEADMSSDYRFGKMNVICEGYDHPNDPYILRGSCGLEYTLDYTESGEKKHRKSGGGWFGSDSKQGGHRKKHSDSGWSSLSVIVIAVVFMYLIYNFCISATRPRQVDGDTQRPFPHSDTTYRAPGSTPYGGASAYQRRSDPSAPSAPPQPGFKTEYMPPPYTDAPPAYEEHMQGASAPRAATENSGPGFWSGAALGGLTGYMFGSSGSRTNTHRHAERDYGGSSWFSSGSDSQHRHHSSSRSDSSGDGGSSRTATGFASTSRR